MMGGLTKQRKERTQYAFWREKRGVGLFWRERRDGETKTNDVSIFFNAAL